MSNYRIFHVERGGRLRLGETFAAAQDDEAVTKATPLLRPGQAAELWQGGRLVGRFSPAHQFSAARA